MKSLEKRFWSKINKLGPDECWLWTGATQGFGYGVLNSCVNNKLVRAHRLSWNIHNGDIPANMFVCHKCDNPLCVNPKHLFIGSNTDNVHDMWKKGRASPPPRNGSIPPLHLGENHPNSKLTGAKVLEIRKLSRDGINGRQLASLFKITPAQISNILRNKQWRHIS